MYANSEAAQQLREANRKIVQRYFEIPHNCEEQIAMYAPDCTMEQPFFTPGQPPMPIFPPEDGPAPDWPEGFEPPEFTPEWHWGETTILGTDDPNFFFAHNTGWGKQLIADNTLQHYENEYFHTFTFRDGKIVNYCEITNPLSLMKTMGLRFDPLPLPEETLAALIEIYKQNNS